MFAARHQQRRAGFHEHLGRDLVDLAQLGLGHAGALGGLGRAHGLGHDPGGPAGHRAAVLADMAGEVLGEDAGLLVGQQHLGCGRREDDRLVHLRVELLEGLQRDAGQAGGQLDIDVAIDPHAQEVGVVGHRRQRECIALGRENDVLDRLQLGHVVARFVGDLQAFVVGRQAQTLVARDGLLHIARAPVVGGQREMPVAEHLVQPAQVVEGGTRRREHIAAVVAEDVLLEVEVTSGGRHELPHAGGLGAGHGMRDEGAFDEGQQGQFARHAALLNLLQDVEEVAAAAGRHALDVVGPGAVPGLGLADPVVVQILQLKALAQPRPQVGVHIGRVEVHLLAGAQSVFQQARRALTRRHEGGGRRRGRQGCGDRGRWGGRRVGGRCR
mmetsp:Transcript_23372/g.55587  ORF Transcript_23372/g.55587 Transcript_23372/m.55587 type:complete len:384 (+) Transcript_23372:342-1493(+)